ncbi:MAG: hypothetical protein PVJ55_07275 [Anaerolineae bacterium]
MTRRIVGALLMLLGVLGVALSALGIVYVWRAADDVSAAADDTLLLMSDTLKDLDRSLDVASTTLDGAVVAVDGLYTTTLDVGQTLSSTGRTVDEMAGLAEDDLPESLEASLVALDALEETSAVIDQLLRGLRQLGVGSYDPAIPLDQAVAEAVAGLQPVPGSLRAMGEGLYETSASLEQVQGGIALMADHMVGIRRNLVDADAALSSHRATLRRLDTRIRAIRQDVDRPIKAVAGGATMLLSWIGISQMAIVRWGIGLWRRRHTQPESA